MDESALQTRLSRIERLQYLVLALLLVHLVFYVVDWTGPWLTGLAALGVGTLAFATLLVYRRQNRSSAGA